jgi:hypothetical protein
MMERANDRGSRSSGERIVIVDGKRDRSLEGKSPLEIAEALKERRAKQKPGARVRAKIDSGLKQRGLK